MTSLYRAGRAAVVLAALAGLCGTAPAEISWTPLTFRQVSGTRPFVPVKLNGEPFLFMVHGNAGFFAMTTHANANKAGVTDIIQTSAFGIDAPGHVSALGRGKATLQTLQVGGDVIREVPLAVFEVMPEPEMNGMLGIGWLRARKVIVDYSNGRLGIPSTAEDAAQQRTALLAQGYVAHALAWDAASQRYTLMGRLNGVDARFVVSTVSHMTIDTALAARAGVTLSPPVDSYAGPTGARGYQYQNASPLQLVVDGQPANLPTADIHDIYAYDNDPRPAADALVGGYLGCEFLLSNKGVVDFGANVLYLKP